MNKIYNPTPENWSAILERPTKTIDDIELTVKEIFKEVQKKGDEAIAKYTSLFDGVIVGNQKVSETEINEAIAAVSPELKEAILLAKGNITKFHAAQRTSRVEVETMEGLIAGKKKGRFKK